MHTIRRDKRGAERGVRHLGGPLYRVESYRLPGVSYIVDLASGICDCPDYVYRGGGCKHLRYARIEAERQAFETARALPVSTLQRQIWRPDLRPETRGGISTALFEVAQNASRAARGA